MATAAELEIKVKADVDNANKGLNTLQQNLAKTAVSATKMDSAFKSSAKGTTQATAALIDVGRVMQDLPFGFIGIANNLNPLAESFKRLRTETGSTGGAIKSLVAGLAGGGGLGLALSAVTAGLTLSQIGISAWTRGFGKAKEITDETAKALEGFKESAAKNIITFNELALTAQKTELPFKTRLEAVNKLRDAYPSYLKNLSDEQILAGQLGAAYEQINKALIAKVALQSAEEKLLPIVKQLVDLRLKEREANEFLSKTPSISREELSRNPQLTKLFVDRAQAQKTLTESTKNAKEIQDEMNRSLNTLSQIITDTAPLDLDKRDKTSKTKDSLDKISDILRQLVIQRDELNRDPLISDLDKPLKDIQLIQNAIEKLRNLKGTDDLVFKLRTEIDTEALAAVGGQLKKAFGDLSTLKLPDIVPPPIKIPVTFDLTKETAEFNQLKGKIEALAAILKIEIPVNFEHMNTTELKNLSKQFEDIRKTGTKSFEQLSEEITNIVEDMQGDIIIAFAKGIGTALGGEGFKDLFKGIFTVLSQGLEELGSALIKMGVGLVAAQIAIKTAKPLQLIAAGIGLEILGSLIQSKLAKFDEGGIVTQNMVGLLHGREAVIPLDRLHDFIPSSEESKGFIAETRISGQDLIILLKRGERLNGRTY